MRRIYATFDGAHMGANLELSNAAQIVTFTGTPTNTHRKVRSTIGLSEDSGQVEFLVYGDEALGTGKVFLGLMNGSASTNRFVGEDANSFGYQIDDGTLWNDNGAIDGFAPAAKGQIVKIVYDATSSQATFFVDGNIVGSCALPQVGSPPVNDTWYFAATVSGTTAGGLLVFCNAGQQDFASDGLDGWWSPVESIAPILLANESFLSARDDAIPNQRYDAVDGCIADTEQFTINRGASWWPDGSGTSTDNGIGSLRISDPDDTYADLLAGDVRDLPVVFKMVPAGGSMADAYLRGKAVIERVEADGDFFKVLYFVGPMAELQSRLQGRLFLPNAQEQAAGRPWPVCVGGPRNFEPVLYDDENNLYAASHIPMTGLGLLRVQGYPIVSGTDFTVTQDLLGFKLQASGSPPTLPSGKPLGKFTAEISTSGGSYDPGNPDYLAGAGQWLTDAGGGMPTGWDERGSSTGTNDPYWTSAHHLRFPLDYLTKSYIEIYAPIIKAGRSYAYSIEVRHMPSQALGGVYGDGYAILQLTYINPISSGITAFSLGWGKDGATRGFYRAGVFTGIFSNTTGVDQALIIAAHGNNQTGVYGELGDVILQELPDVADNVALEGATLEQYLRMMIETLGKKPASTWRAEDAAAIDARTGYKYSIWTALDAMTIEQAIQPALDSCCAAMFPRRDGTLGICQLIDPDSVADEDLAFDIDGDSDFLSQMTVRQYTAPGLTTQMAIRRNYSPYTPSDYGDYTPDDIPVTVRKKLEAQYQQIVYTGAQVAGMYRHALTAPPLPSLLDLAAHGQASIDATGGFFTVPRREFIVDVSMPPDSMLEVGQVGRIRYKYHGLSLGKKVILRAFAPEYPADEKATVIFLG